MLKIAEETCLATTVILADTREVIMITKDEITFVLQNVGRGNATGIYGIIIDILERFKRSIPQQISTTNTAYTKHYSV